MMLPRKIHTAAEWRELLTGARRNLRRCYPTPERDRAIVRVGDSFASVVRHEGPVDGAHEADLRNALQAASFVIELDRAERGAA